jgi:hypothetical protein
MGAPVGLGVGPPLEGWAWLATASRSRAARGKKRNIKKKKVVKGKFDNVNKATKIYKK